MSVGTIKYYFHCKFKENECTVALRDVQYESFLNEIEYIDKVSTQTRKDTFWAFLAKCIASSFLFLEPLRKLVLHVVVKPLEFIS